MKELRTEKLPRVERTVQAPAPEQAPTPERSAEEKRTAGDAAIEHIPAGQQQSVQSADAGVPTIPPKDDELQAIENILAEGLQSFFLSLTPQAQYEFKMAGETTAQKIKEAVLKKTTRIKDIVHLIIGWLKSLPGVNKFFIEQEAKIKADKIMRYYKS